MPSSLLGHGGAGAAVPYVTLGELRLLACPATERLRHAHPSAGMLTVAVPSGTGSTPTAVTDGGGGADMRHASSRHSARTSDSCGLMPRLCRSGFLAAPLRSGRRQVARCVNECWRRQSETAAFWGRVVPEVLGGESRYARVRKVIRV